MESRAHYALIGAFALAIVAIGFFSVYWLSGGGSRPAGTQTYKVIFAGSISGLGRGSFVLFNGVRVGEVTEINLLPQDPAHVYALINVDARVPVRADTKAQLESSGFTGVQSIALAGGDIHAPLLVKPADGAPPVIIAEHSSFQDLLVAAHSITGQASDLLAKANKLLDDDAPPLNASIKNIQKFSDALASNSDGVKQFLSAMTEVGHKIGPLSDKLATLADDTDHVVKAVDPDQVKSMIKNLSELSAKLNKDADQVQTVLTSLNGFFKTTDSKGAFEEVAEAAKSIHTLADHLDERTKDLTANLNHFTGAGLHQYEALAVDGRKTLQDLDAAIKSIQDNPQQFIFGKKAH